MTPDWILALIGGTGAAALAIALPATQYLRGRRDDRKSAAQARTAESVAEVLSATLELTTALAITRWRYPGREIMAVPSAVMRFAARELAEHPEISLWLLGKVEDLTKPLYALSHQRFRLGAIEAKEDVVRELAEISGELMLWHQGLRSKAHFREINAARHAMSLENGAVPD